jgi:hypothetical protein
VGVCGQAPLRGCLPCPPLPLTLEPREPPRHNSRCRVLDQCVGDPCMHRACPDLSQTKRGECGCCLVEGLLSLRAQLTPSQLANTVLLTVLLGTRVRVCGGAGLQSISVFKCERDHTFVQPGSCPRCQRERERESQQGSPECECPLITSDPFTALSLRQQITHRCGWVAPRRWPRSSRRSSRGQSSVDGR